MSAPPHNQIHIHLGFLQPPPEIEPSFASRLAERRRQLAHIAQAVKSELADADAALGMACAGHPGTTRHPADRETAVWLARSYPVLAIRAPVLASLDGKIEYPGDPMCLYSALSVAIDQAIRARQAALSQDDPYNDVCPRWGRLPTREYRFSANGDGIRDYAGDDPNTDQAVFAPEIWGDEIRRQLERILRALQPRVVLISAVSPGHRYAVDMAQTIRRCLPNALIVLGGPHLDETMRYCDETGKLELAYSSTLRAMADRRIEPVFDFLISGDGYYALDLLMKAISISMDLETRTACVADVARNLDALAPVAGALPGRALIVAVNGSDIHAYPLRGRPIDLGELPAPYRAFAIRARFPIFQSPDGSIQRTAHFMAADSCPYHCYYCSESVAVSGQIVRFACAPTEAALDRVLECVSYGAEALFFDDPIFWGGNIRLMLEFCNALAKAKRLAETDRPKRHAWLHGDTDWQRLIQLQWGAQLTIEFVTSLQSRDKALEMLRAMRAAGCTYLYFGIESLSPTIMSRIHKNLGRGESPAWPDKVRAALQVAKEANLRAGASVLFGMDGETRATIDETVAGVERLLAQGLLYIASPNILTYHPATAITLEHQKQDQLDYHSLGVAVQPPYSYFEEAFPQLVSRELSEDDIWYIYHQTRLHWSRENRIDPYAVHDNAIRDVWGAAPSGELARGDQEPPIFDMEIPCAPRLPETGVPQVSSQ